MLGEVQLQPPPIQQNPSDSDPLLGHEDKVEDDESPGSSTEIGSQEDVEAGLLPCCRICLETDSDPEDELISPCMCKGTQQFVHRSCLDHWRSVKEGFAFSHCTTCKAQFHLRVETFEDNSWRKIKFRLFVARDVFLVFLAIQTVIAAIGGFAYIMDKDGNFRNSFDDGWDRILSKHPIPFYYCIGNQWLKLLCVCPWFFAMKFSDIRVPYFSTSSEIFVICFEILLHVLCESQIILQIVMLSIYSHVGDERDISRHLNKFN